MNFLTHLFDINTTFFTVANYPMSYIEFFGTIFNIWCVWLTARAKTLSWPIGLLGSVLYLFLFFQIQLYSDFFEQVYFILTGVMGWYMWVRNKKEIDETKDVVIVSLNSIKENAVYVAILIVGTAIMTYVTMNLTVWLPAYFTEPVSLPVLDALTTVMSFIAQWLLMKKKVESWALWILVDIIGIGLYWYKGVRFISLEYVLFLIIATAGLFNWIKNYKLHKLYDKSTQQSIQEGVSDREVLPAPQWS